MDGAGGAEMGESLHNEKSLDIPIYVNTLQTFETCGYFDASYKRRYPSREKPSKIVKLGKGRTIEIIPTQKYGYANARDMDFKRALFRIIDERAKAVERVNGDGSKTIHYQVPQPVHIQSKTVIRYAGGHPNPKWRKYLNNYLHRNKATSMVGDIEDPKTREYSRYDVSLFSQVITKGERTKDGAEAEEHLIWLSDYALRVYYWHRTRKEDISFHNSLTKPISKVLYPYLDSGWFASITKGGKSYTKNYPSTCLFLSIPAYKSLARVKQQLDPAHQELQASGYLDSWEYRKGVEGDWLVTWLPGEKWFADMKARGHTVHRTLPPPKKVAVAPPDKKESCSFCNTQGFITFERLGDSSSFATRCEHTQDFVTGVERSMSARALP